MEISSALLVDHFRDVPACKLSAYISCFFDAADVNKNGVLEVPEVQKALRDLGKTCTVHDVQQFFRKVGAEDHAIDREHFEQAVRSFQGWDRGWGLNNPRQRTPQSSTPAIDVLG